MENRRETLKTGGKRMRRCGIFSANLSCFILITFLTLDFGIISASAVKRDVEGLESRESDYETVYGVIDPDSEAIDPIVEPSVGDVFTLLKTIQVELIALRNKNTEENEELKSQIYDLRVEILDQGDQIEEVNKTATKIVKSQSQIKQKIGANHAEMKEEFADLSKDLKGQMTTLSNQQKEIQTAVQSRNWSSPSAALTDPQFYSMSQFSGISYAPTSSDWKTKCVDLDSPKSSVKTGGHCLLICPGKNCKSENFGRSKIKCQKITAETKEVGNIKDVGFGFGSEIKSFRQC